MDMENRVGNNCGSGGGSWAGQKRAKGETWDNCNRITIKYLIKNYVKKKVECYFKLSQKHILNIYSALV